MKYSCVLFDLDGTITDPAEGITKSVEYALRRYGITVCDRRELYPFIGPPLAEAFMQYYSFSREQAFEAVEVYREYFSVTGLFENRIYDGVFELLSYLRDSGRNSILATSKPAVFANRILEHFSLTEYFTFVSGSELDGRRVNKREVIEYALLTSGASAEECLMVGDRVFDAEGAESFGMDFAAAMYGYGSVEEFDRPSVTYRVNSPAELTELFRRFDTEH